MQPASNHGANGENMTYKKYREEELKEYLLSHAEIGSFYITCLDDSSSGLINYLDSDGKNWCLMEDDDELIADSVEFLKKQGVPLFNDINAAQEFEDRHGVSVDKRTRTEQ
jgi:hypothetical protein